MRAAKTYLSQLHRLDKLIDNKLAELNSLKELSISISAIAYDEDKVQTSGPSDKAGNIIAKIVDLEKDINRDIDRLIDIKKEVMITIDKIEDHDLRCLLQYRYLQFKTWESIAVEMGYSYQWVHKLHSKALEEVENLIS